jgi:hypothetical protein
LIIAGVMQFLSDAPRIAGVQQCSQEPWLMVQPLEQTLTREQRLMLVPSMMTPLGEQR